jgi:outer membrane protein assembly factor BamB
MLHAKDALALCVAVGATIYSVHSRGGSVRLAPAWSVMAHYDHDTGALDQAPAPVVADLDGDGTPEVVIATRDGRLQLTEPQYGAPGRVAWSRLHVKTEVSLRVGGVGLSTGRRPVALGAGPLREAKAPTRAKQIVVILTEDWTVHAFDHELQPLWEHSLASKSAGSLNEASLLIAPRSLYLGDAGVVLVGGRTAPRVHAHEQLGADDAVTPSHHDYFALEGGSGSLRWQHRAGDFHEDSVTDRHFSPQACDPAQPARELRPASAWSLTRIADAHR